VQPTAGKRKSFKFDRFLLLSRVCRDDAAMAEGGAGAKGKKHASKGEEVYVYIRPEDEVLHQLAEWSCVWPVEGKPASDGLQPCRMLCLVHASQVAEVRERLVALVTKHATSAEPTEPKVAAKGAKAAPKKAAKRNAEPEVEVEEVAPEPKVAAKGAKAAPKKAAKRKAEPEVEVEEVAPEPKVAAKAAKAAPKAAKAKAAAPPRRATRGRAAA
jgi:outer membrane biosynthesis protein TonB